jgi:excisionase family DNA binding protein
MLLPSSPTSFPSSGLQERPVLNVAEAAEMLGVSQWLVLQQVGRGTIPHKRVGRRILFPRALFLAWLESTDHEPSYRPEVPLRLAAGHRR